MTHLAVDDTEKADLINDFFANIGIRLGRANSDRTGSVPSVTDITVSEHWLKAIKPNKSAGPDDIPPKLLKLAEHRLEESSPDSGVQERWRSWHEQLQPDIASECS